VLRVSKSYHYLKGVLSFLMVIFCHSYYAQGDLLIEAQRLCNEKKFDLALPIAEKTIIHPETKNDPASWYTRSFVYFHIYKQAGQYNTIKINELDTSMSSALHSIKLDTGKVYTNENNVILKNGAIYYYKISTVLLQDSLNFSKSEKFYEKYKKYTSFIDSNFDFKQKDINYYNTTGGIFADQYMKNNFNQKYGDIAKSALLKVLELDNKNISANINLGILYYNQGATLMRMMDYDVDLAQLDVIQENAKKLFKQSLPFMIKVYELDPKAEKALESLQGIYSALLDEEKANEFKQKKEALNKP
jgi:hypothetical protein